MKTFTRRRKSSQPEELTNGPLAKRSGGNPVPAQDDPYELKDCDDQNFSGVTAARSPRLEKPGTTSASPQNQGAFKRKLGGNAAFVQRKEARVEASVGSAAVKRRTTLVNELTPPPEDVPATRRTQSAQKEEPASLSRRHHQNPPLQQAPAPCQQQATPPRKQQQQQQAATPPHHQQQATPGQSEVNDDSNTPNAIDRLNKGTPNPAGQLPPTGRSLFSRRPLRVSAAATVPVAAAPAEPVVVAAAFIAAASDGGGGDGGGGVHQTDGNEAGVGFSGRDQATAPPGLPSQEAGQAVKGASKRLQSPGTTSMRDANVAVQLARNVTAAGAGGRRGDLETREAAPVARQQQPPHQALQGPPPLQPLPPCPAASVPVGLPAPAGGVAPSPPPPTALRHGSEPATTFHASGRAAQIHSTQTVVAAAAAANTATATVTAAAAAAGGSGRAPVTQITSVAIQAAVTGTGRAGRPIGRGRLPGPSPVGQQNPSALAGASKMGSTAAAAAVVPTPPKSDPCAAARPPLARSAATAGATAVAAGTSAAAGPAAAAAAGASKGAAGIRTFVATARQGTPPVGEELSRAAWDGSRAASQGRICGRIGSQGDSVGAAASAETGAAAAAAAAAAHSIVEAQERGELLQLQDDAQYALDGLASMDKAQAAAGGGGGGGSGPPQGLGLVRESAAALACILATRRGRAALSQPVNLAMKALTSLARVAVVPRDPVAALAAAVILLSLVQEDALPAYGASYAAAVLLRHVLLQAEADPPPLLQPRPGEVPTAPGGGDSTASASGAGGGGPASAWGLLQEARSAGTASSGAGAGSSSCDGAMLKLLRLIQEGPLARQIGRTDLVTGPLPLVLLSMVVAGEASSARIQYAERFKDNLLKAGTLSVLGRLVAVRRDAVVRHVYDKRTAASAAPAAPGMASQEALAGACLAGPDGGGSTGPPSLAGHDPQPKGTGDGGPAAQSPGRGPPLEGRQERGLKAGVSGGGDGHGHGDGSGKGRVGLTGLEDPYMFLGSEPLSVSQTRASLLPPSAGTQPLPPPPPSLSPSAETAAPPPAAPPAPLPLWCLWELQLLLRVLENATFTHKRNEQELLALRVGTALPMEHAIAAATAAAAAAAAAGAAALAPGSQLIGSQPPASQLAGSQGSQQALELLEPPKPPAEADATEGAPFVAVLVDIVRQLSLLMDGDGGEGDPGGSARRAAGVAPPSVAVPPSVAAVCQVGVAVLMNLTHEHPDGVAVVAAAGGLQAVGGLVWRCCRPHLAAAPLPAALQQQREQGWLRVCRDAILASMEVLSVSLGFLINMTSLSSENQRALRAAALTVPAPPPPLRTAAVPQPQAGQQMPTPTPTQDSWPGLPDPLAASPTPSPLRCQQAGAAGWGGVGQLAEGDAAGAGAGSSNRVAAHAPRMVPLLCAVLNAMSDSAKPEAGAEGEEGIPPYGRPAGRGIEGGSNDEDQGAGDGGRACVGSTSPGGESGDLRRGAAQPRHDEVTEDALQEGLQGGQASIAQAYSAILLGYLVAGSDAEAEAAAGDGDGGTVGDDAEGTNACSAAAARAEARSLLVGGSLRPVARGISRCLAFYCRAGAITDSTRDALSALLQRLVRLEEMENPSSETVASVSGRVEVADWL